MTIAERLRRALVTVAADERFTYAVMCLRDNSELRFCHRVDERWAKAVGGNQPVDGSGLAGAFLSAITMFRLNAKHLDIQFDDGSRWEATVPGMKPP